MIGVELGVNYNAFERELKNAMKEASLEIQKNMSYEIKQIVRDAANKILPREIAKYAPTENQERNVLSGGYNDKNGSGNKPV